MVVLVAVEEVMEGDVVEGGVVEEGAEVAVRCE